MQAKKVRLAPSGKWNTQEGLIHYKRKRDRYTYRPTDHPDESWPCFQIGHEEVFDEDEKFLSVGPVGPVRRTALAAACRSTCSTLRTSRLFSGSWACERRLCAWGHRLAVLRNTCTLAVHE